MEITVDPVATAGVVEALRAMDGVVTVSLQPGRSIKPPGDVISASVLNTAADEVLALLQDTERHGPLSIATSSVDSLIDTESQPLIRGDVDEALWEEAETALRRHTRPTMNFFLTTAAGGIIAACALIASSEATEAVALVAAAIIAPAFEPLANIALAAVNRHGQVFRSAISSAVLSYVILIVAGLATMLALRAGGHAFVTDFLHNSSAHEVQHPPTINLVISACGALAGVVMVAAGRYTQLAGALVALQLLPAAVSIGIALEIGHGAAAAHSLGRLGIDVGMVLVAGLLIFALKHVLVHGRRRIHR